MSTTLDKNDGGPAFPTDSARQISTNGYHFEGMTLRDYFAAKVLQGMMADHTRDNSPDELSKGAYKIADAMLKERAK